MSRLLVSLSLPIFFLLGWNISLEVASRTGEEIRVRVEAYDPRDLLAGHYLLFALAFDGERPCADTSQTEICMCFDKKDGSKFHSVSWSGSCVNAPKGCFAKLKGECLYGRFQTGVEKYFIPDRLSPVLQRVPDNSSITMSVSKLETAIVKEFFVGDEKLEDYGERLLRERSTK